MKFLKLYLGKIGSGKSFIARKDCLKDNSYFIEVSNLVMRFVSKSNPTREDLQAVKIQMKSNSTWLLDALIDEIERVENNSIIISGLRERSIYEELDKRYIISEIIIVEADEKLRCLRRGFSLDQLKRAEERDNQIGLNTLLEAVKSKSKICINNYEYTR